MFENGDDYIGYVVNGIPHGSGQYYQRASNTYSADILSSIWVNGKNRKIINTNMPLGRKKQPTSLIDDKNVDLTLLPRRRTYFNKQKQSIPLVNGMLEGFNYDGNDMLDNMINEISDRCEYFYLHGFKFGREKSIEQHSDIIKYKEYIEGRLCGCVISIYGTAICETIMFIRNAQMVGYCSSYDELSHICSKYSRHTYNFISEYVNKLDKYFASTYTIPHLVHYGDRVVSHYTGYLSIVDCKPTTFGRIRFTDGTVFFDNQIDDSIYRKTYAVNGAIGIIFE